MALPVILIHSSGSSNASAANASGAGPATALTGTAASYSTATVTLDGSPDLSGVAADGSHVIYLATSTGVRYFKITAVDNGADTVTVTPNPAGTATGLAWAIGGVLSSIGAANHKLLFDNGGADGDAMPGWIVEMQSGHAETITGDLDLRRSGDGTSGPIVLRGAIGAATRPVVTCGTSRIVWRGSYQRVEFFDLVASGGPIGTLVSAFSGAEVWARGMRLSGATGGTGIIVSVAQIFVEGCEISGYETGVSVGQNSALIGNWIHGCSGDGILGSSGSYTGLMIYNNIISGCGGDGIDITQTRVDNFSAVRIVGNTIYNCTGSGLKYSGDNDGMASLLIMNNIFSTVLYGIEFGTGITAVEVESRGAQIFNNNFHTLTSGVSNLTLTNNFNSLTLDPAFTSAGSGNFAIGANLKGKGYPVGGAQAIGFSATANYLDIGAAQREEPAGGGSGSIGQGLLRGLVNR